MTRRHRNRLDRQHGRAAVEFALVLPLYLGRVMWHYAAMQHAARNDARFLASVPLVIMRDPNKVGHAVQLTDDIVRAHLGERNPGAYPAIVDKQCNGITCSGYANPTTVRAVVQMTVQDIFFPEYAQMSIALITEATVACLEK